MTMLNSLAGALREAGMNYDNHIDGPDFYKYLVKAVLERMREPTNDMANEYYKLSQGTEIFYVANWQRSIDAILNER